MFEFSLEFFDRCVHVYSLFFAFEAYIIYQLQIYFTKYRDTRFNNFCNCMLRIIFILALTYKWMNIGQWEIYTHVARNVETFSNILYPDWNPKHLQQVFLLSLPTYLEINILAYLEI